MITGIFKYLLYIIHTMKTKEHNKGEIVIYKAKDGKTSLDVKLEQETVWLSINQMTELFGRDKSVISRHIKNVYENKELNKD